MRNVALLPFNNMRVEMFIPLQVKQVREVANLSERKNLHTPVYGVKEFVCLSVRL